MVNLKNNIEQIKKFLRQALQKFSSEYGPPKLIGIYCCPWKGWISVNFTLTNENKDNCPDFEYVEFDIIEFEEWQTEYENETPEFKIAGSIKKHNHDLGDEHLNNLFFEYLRPIAIEFVSVDQSNVLLQMLDSEKIELITNEAF